MPGLLLAQSGKYTINGKIGKLSAPAKAYLVYERTVDSALITNGNFSFTGSISSPTLGWLAIDKNGTGIRTGTSIELYLEPATITVVSPDSLANAKVTGGPINADKDRLTIALAPFMREREAMNKEYGAASAEKRKSKEFVDYTNKWAAKLQKQQRAIYFTFIKVNPNSWFSLEALRSIAKTIPDSVAKIESVFNSLSKSVRSTYMGTYYAEQIAEMKKTPIKDSILVPYTAPDFTQSDTTGKAVSLHDFKGKYVLVDFWASWCGPCRAENPNVVKAYSKYKDKGLNILGISLDGKSQKAAWIKAINDDHLTWTQVSDLQGWGNEAAMLYKVRGIPQNFLVNPEGKVIAENLRGDDLENKLAELLK
ncbi:TlpA disulfide reductase family protein [Pedobacter nutrimenti]|uniref:TlpA disulfide reductase family protein n=1 Tax=Pedobacter nutrimenti TaxID=1241337 RepID=UPI00292D0FC3|nr:TlpA disulfide reductase family protein [Pedobacter nutrimenti]